MTGGASVWGRAHRRDPLPRARGLCLQVQVTGTQGQAGTGPSGRPGWTVWVQILPGPPLTV